MAAARSAVALFVGLCCALAVGAEPLVAPGARLTCGMQEIGGEVKCWGKRAWLPYSDAELTAWWADVNDGIVGDDETEVPGNLPAIAFGGNRSIVHITCGQEACCVLDTDQDVTCWGYGANGVLGYESTNSVTNVESTPPVDLGTGKKAADVQMGSYHTCALLTTGEVVCWGLGGYGQLGTEAKTHVGRNAFTMGDNLKVIDFGSGRTATALAVGGESSCALLSDGQVRCWGRNNRGQLGLESSAQDFGGNAGELGANWPPTVLPSGLSVLKISMGKETGCALMSDDKVYCWGNCYGGVCGIPSKMVGTVAGTMGDNMAAANLPEGVRDVMVGISPGSLDFTCVITLSNETRCFGYDGYGMANQPCYGDLAGTEKVLDFGAGRYAVKLFKSRVIAMTCALLNTDEVACWGAVSATSGSDAARASTYGEMGGGRWTASGTTYGCVDAEWGADGVHTLMWDPLIPTSTTATTSTTTSTTTASTTTTSTTTQTTTTTTTSLTSTSTSTTSTTSTTSVSTTSTSSATSTTTSATSTTTSATSTSTVSTTSTSETATTTSQTKTTTTTTTTTTTKGNKIESSSTTRSVTVLHASFALLVAAAAAAAP